MKDSQHVPFCVSVYSGKSTTFVAVTFIQHLLSDRPRWKTLRCLFHRRQPISPRELTLSCLSLFMPTSRTGLQIREMRISLLGIERSVPVKAEAAFLLSSLKTPKMVVNQIYIYSAR